MNTKTFEILDSSKIQSFSIKVTEPIDKKYLLEFLRTAITNQHPILTKNSKFYYQFIPSTLSYEIIVFDANRHNTLPEPFLFLSLCSKGKSELFITKEYFCVFKNEILLLYKKIENILQEDIQLYIEQLYKIKIDKVTIVNKTKLDLVKNRFTNNSLEHKSYFYSVDKDNSFSLFLFFVFFVSIIFLLSLYSVYNKKYSVVTKPNTITQYEKGYKKLYQLSEEINKTPIAKMVKFTTYCRDNSIAIEKLQYKNSKLFIELTTKNRTKILQKIRDYDEKIDIRSILFDTVLKIYKVNIIIDVKK